MSKIIEQRMCAEYPGIERTITVFDDDIIEVEFNLPFSNEVGIRFWKLFKNAQEENSHLKKYYSESANSGLYENLPESQIKNSWEKLLADTLEGKVHLPDNGRDYVYKGSMESLKPQFGVG